MPPFQKFNFQTIRKADSVVVLCAGPSLRQNKDRIKAYIKENSSVVLSANYDYTNSIGIKSDYTYITDQMKLFENILFITSALILPIRMKTDSHLKDKVRSTLRGSRGDILDYTRKRSRHIKSLYMIGDKRGDTVYSERELIKIDKYGNFPYKRLGSAGQGCVLLSMIFRPKKILIVGMDGAIPGDISKKEMYDGKIVKYASEKKYQDVLHYLTNVLFPSLAYYKIIVESFENVAFYDIDKRQLGIRVI